MKTTIGLFLTALALVGSAAMTDAMQKIGAWRSPEIERRILVNERGEFVVDRRGTICLCDCEDLR